MIAANGLGRILLSLFILYGLFGCVGSPPIEEYNLANTALVAAKQNQAGRFAPGFLSQAEDYCRQGVADYNDRQYKSATVNFERCRSFAEKAENHTVLKRAETGDFQ